MARLAPRQTYNLPFRITAVSNGERRITFAPSILRHKAPIETQLWGSGLHQSPDRGNCQRHSVMCLLMGHSSVPHCTVKRLWCTVKHRELNKNRKARECIFHESSLILWQEVLTMRRKGCDTTRQHTSRLIRGLLLIPVRRCPPVPWGRKMEEVIDSSHHNLWEGQTLPFPFWVTRVIILKFWKGPHKGYFCSSVMSRHQRVWVWATVALTNSRYCSLLFPGMFLDP